MRGTLLSSPTLKLSGAHYFSIHALYSWFIFRDLSSVPEDAALKPSSTTTTEAPNSRLRSAIAPNLELHAMTEGAEKGHVLRGGHRRQTAGTVHGTKLYSLALRPSLPQPAPGGSR